MNVTRVRTRERGARQWCSGRSTPATEWTHHSSLCPVRIVLGARGGVLAAPLSAGGSVTSACAPSCGSVAAALSVRVALEREWSTRTICTQRRHRSLSSGAQRLAPECGRDRLCRATFIRHHPRGPSWQSVWGCLTAFLSRTRILSDAGPAPPDSDRRSVVQVHEGRRDPFITHRPAGIHLLLYESPRPSALRPVQQVRGASSRLPPSRRIRPNNLCSIMAPCVMCYV